MKRTFIIKTIVDSILLILLGAISITFSALFLRTFHQGFFCKYKNVLLISIIIINVILAILSIIFSLKNNAFIFKISILTLGLIALLLVVIYILKITGVFNKINSIEALRNYVASFGYLAVFVFILINFLQVVILPIPGVVSIGTGVALFGPLKTAIFSFIGIWLGSLVAFFIGRYLGYKVVKWLVGKESLDKWLKSVKNKDRVVLTVMFLFPFFPDDILCFIAGITTMSNAYFIIMITICRLISIFTTAYSINGSIIPYNTWWGILLWVVLFALTTYFSYIIYKKGDKIEKFFKKKFKKYAKGNSSR